MPTVRPIQPGSAQQLRPLLQTDLEYASLRIATPAQQSEREVARIDRALASGGFGFVIGDSGLCLVRHLAWDTEHFGWPCADLCRLYMSPAASSDELRALIDTTLAEAHARGVRLLSARLLTRHLAALDLLLHRGFSLLDTSIELGGRPSPPQPTGADAGLARVRPGVPSDAAALRAIARTFVDNRFCRDPRIRTEQATAVYERWIDGALQRGHVLVAELAGQPAGFATHEHPAEGHAPVGIIGLVVIAEAQRGRGAFDPLIRHSAEHLDTAAVVTSTQASNIASLRAFGRNALLPIGSRHILHGWL